MEDFMTHFHELVTVDKSKSDVQELYGCILPNSTDIKAGPKSRRYIKCSHDHASKYHFTADDLSSCSSPSPLAVKCTLSEDSACTAFTKKAKNTVISVGSKSSSVVSDDEKVKVTVKDKVQLKQMSIGKMLDLKLSP